MAVFPVGLSAERLEKWGRKLEIRRDVVMRTKQGNRVSAY